MALNREQFQELRDKGLSVDQIVRFEAGETPQAPTQSKSLLRPKELASSVGSSIKGNFQSAASDIQEQQQRFEAGEIGLGRNLFTQFGQGAQAGLTSAFDVAVGGVSALTPDFIEDPIRRKAGAGLEKVAGLSVGGGATVGDVFSNLDEGLVKTLGFLGIDLDPEDPADAQLIKDIGAGALTVADLATFGVGAKATAKAGAKVGEKAGTTGRGLVETAEQDIKATVQESLQKFVIDDTTPKKREKLSSRTTEGEGTFGARTVQLTDHERGIVDTLSEVEGVNPRRSSLYNLNKVTKEVNTISKSLESQLKASKIAVPKKEVLASLRAKLETIKADDLDLIGDPSAQRIADKLFEKAEELIKASDGSPLGLLKARREFDKQALIKKPKTFEKEGPHNTSVRAARDTINDELISRSKDIDVQNSLKRQSQLLQASDVMSVKAGREAATRFGRTLDSLKRLTTLRGELTGVLGTITGTGVLAASAIFGPAFATTAGAVLAGILIRKLLTSPATRKKVGEVLIAIEKALPKATKKEKAVLVPLRDQLKELMDDISDTPNQQGGFVTNPLQRKELEAKKDEILNNKSVTEKQRKKAIDAADKELGLN